MKCKKFIPTFSMSFLLLFLLSGCGEQQTAKPANELTFSLDDIKNITISYDDENISFFESENNNLIIKEYMSKDKKSYHAKVSENKDSIQISEGAKPFFKDGFTRYVEVYLPNSYSENLKVTTTNGNIDMSEVELDMNEIRVDTTSGIFKLNKAAAEDIYFSSTSGELELGSIIASQIRIETTRGEVICEKADGNVTYVSTSGNAEFKSVIGSGTYKVNNSGKLSVTYDEVTGDLSFFNKNDDVELCLPATLSFEFEAITKNGSINTNFQGDISVKGELTRGTVGKNPTATVKVETKNGDIEVIR